MKVCFLPASFVLLLAPAWCGAVDSLSLHALFKDKAIVIVDGARRVLKTGESSPEGIKLVGTDTREETATVEVDGQVQVLTLGMVRSGFAAPGKARITLYAQGGGHFFADGLINDAPIRFMVDTGATTIALSSVAATRIGLDYRRLGKPGAANTAGGIVRTYNLKLGKVQIGEITLFNVDAGVIEGSFPSEPLLGMSFLGQLDMRRESDRMELLQR